MTQEFVTLPREVVENVRGALAYVGVGNAFENPNLAQSTCKQAIWKLDHALRAALEQPQNHVPDAGNMVQAGWKLVPMEPTRDMLTKWIKAPVVSNTTAPSLYRAMLAAAPQPPAVEQSKVEQGPFYLAGGARYKITHLEGAGYCIHGLPRGLLGQWVAFVDATDNKHMNNQQPKQEPLTDMQKMMCWSRATHDADVLHKTEHQCLMDYASEIEAAHNIK